MRKKKPVVQIYPKTGEVINEFTSLSNAAKHLRMQPNSVWNNANGVTKLCRGFKFEYKDPKKTYNYAEGSKVNPGPKDDQTYTRGSKHKKINLENKNECYCQLCKAKSPTKDIVKICDKCYWAIKDANWKKLLAKPPASALPKGREYSNEKVIRLKDYLLIPNGLVKTVYENSEILILKINLPKKEG